MVLTVILSNLTVILSNIPAYGLPERLIEVVFRLPPKLLLYFGSIDRIPEIVPRPILHKCYERGVVTIRTLSCLLIQQFTDTVDQVEVHPLIVTPNVVLLSGFPLEEHLQNRSAVINHIEPVTHILPSSRSEERRVGKEWRARGAAARDET